MSFTQVHLFTLSISVSGLLQGHLIYSTDDSAASDWMNSGAEYSRWYANIDYLSVKIACWDWWWIYTHGDSVDIDGVFTVH
jgi:hypothetical protein